jgi:glycosyltransferase involved in cell wall biosynthesis
VGEEGGVLLPPGDIDAMSGAALRVLGDPGLRRSARARAVRLFQPGPALSRWEALYKELSCAS